MEPVKTMLTVARFAADAPSRAPRPENRIYHGLEGKHADYPTTHGSRLAGLWPHTPWAQSAPKGKLAPKLRIVIPAMSRTALDEAGRALGDALVGQGLSDEIEYENKEGGGGTAGLAWYVQKYNADPNTLLMGDSNLVGAIALQKPAMDLTKVKPVARLTSDYPVVVVAAARPSRPSTNWWSGCAPMPNRRPWP
jgi:tripartite-type tricarboxylate transporter receptor subunit TctC